MRDTIDMAREAGDDWDSTLSTDKEFLKRFEALVRADERAAPVQEPVGEVVVESMGVRGSDAMRVRMHFYKEIPPVGSKIYTTQPAAPVPLTDEQRSKMYRTAVLRGDSIMVRGDYELGISDAEAAHGITKGGAA